jgi:hypothetical protein
MFMLRYLVPVLGVFLSVAVPAADNQQTLYSNKKQLSLPLSNIETPSSVLKAKLFVTSDQGKTWVMQQEIQVSADAKELPRFRFTVDEDGRYGVMPCTHYRSGTSEPDPTPGQAPPYVIVIDTQAPTIANFDATLIGRSAQKTVVRVTWSVQDPHLAAEPIAIEASADKGINFTTLHRGGKDGAAELVVPTNDKTSDIQLRLAVTDLARNVTISPSRSFQVEPLRVTPEKPVAPADPKAALAQAVATLPTLSEVGANNGQPLPTIPIAPPSHDNPTALVAPTTDSANVTTSTTPTVVVTAPTQKAALQELSNIPTPETTANNNSSTPTADIVVHGKPYIAPPVPPASATPTAENPSQPALVVADNTMDRAYYDKLAQLRGTAPESARQVNRYQTPEKKVAPEPVLPLDGRRAPASSVPMVLPDPMQTLTDARLAVARDAIDDACDLYERLRFTSLGKTALLEQAHLLLLRDRPRDAITAIMSAPIEIVTSPVRLDHGRALLMTNRPDEVEAAVSLIPANAPEARPALLLIVRALLAQNRHSEARRGLEFIAKGKDDTANEARALLAQLPAK